MRDLGSSFREYGPWFSTWVIRESKIRQEIPRTFVFGNAVTEAGQCFRTVFMWKTVSVVRYS